MFCSTKNIMDTIEVVDLASVNISDIYTENSVKEKLNISDIVMSYGNRLKGFIRNRVRNSEDAEDVLQEVYYQLAEADRLLKPIDQMAAWLFTVARNRITDLYRKKKTESIPDIWDDHGDEAFFSELGYLIYNDGNTPEDEYLRSIVWTELDRVLNQLPDEQRDVFELTEMQGLSFKEIALRTGVPINTLISRKRYAVLILRERLKHIYNELLNF